MPDTERWTLLYLEGVLADPEGNTDEARAKALDDLGYWARMQYEQGWRGEAAEAALADRLAEALRLTAEWANAIALPGWSWFDALTEYRAVRGWDVLPATGLPAGVTVNTEPADPGREHVATVTITPEGTTTAWTIGPAINLVVPPNPSPGKYHVLADGTWEQQWGGFGNTGSCTSECTEGHTYRPPCELSPDFMDPEPLWTLRRIREVLDDPFCPEHQRVKALRMLATHQELDERPTPSPDPDDVWCPAHQEFHRPYGDAAAAAEEFDPVAVLGQLARQAAHPDPEGIMRMARQLLDRDRLYDRATGRALHTDDNGKPLLAPDPEPARGVPHLLVQLAGLCAESVNLWYQPNNALGEWQVWTRHPGGTGGSQWGVGDTPYEALAHAYQRVVESIFAGRMQP